MSQLNLKPRLNFDLSGLEIKGTRVLLRPIKRADAARIFTEFNGEITRFMMPQPVDSIDEIYEFIDASGKKLQKLSDIILTIVGTRQNEFLGVCGLHSNEFDTIPELGIWLKKNAHGEKLGREAIHVLVTWVKNNLVSETLCYPVDKRNIASRKIPESLDAVIVSEGERRSLAGNTLPEVVYQIDVLTAVELM